MMIDQKFETLAALVRESRQKDAEAASALAAAQAEWKEINDILTDRMKVLDAYIAQVKSEAIARE